MSENGVPITLMKKSEKQVHWHCNFFRRQERKLIEQKYTEKASQ